MMTSQVALAQPMPAYLGGGTGAVLTLSQTPCNNPANPGACCNSKGTICANWAGAHLVSAGCIQYGVLELEAAFNMPANAGGFYFTATYVVFGGSDPAWNEIDIGMINNVLGQLEFHATVFTANKAAPTGTLMDALNFAQTPIGTSINVNTSIKAINGGVAPQKFYNSSFASQFHTYKVVWTKNTVAWMVDTVVYRNISYAPWRPMSIRQILRTNQGINAVGPQFGDSKVYIRRIRYTPLSDQAVADAYRCTSMFACYGAMPTGAMSTATTFVTLASGDRSTTAAGGRHLLQSLESDGALLQDAVAALLPGMPSGSVNATPSAFGLSLRIDIAGLNPAGLQGAMSALDVYTTDGVQLALTSGLADDFEPASGNVLIQSVSQDAVGAVLSVQVLVSGYASADDVSNDYNALLVRGAKVLGNSAAAVNNALGLATTLYVTLSEAVTNSTDPDFPGLPPAAHPPGPAAFLADPSRCPNYPASWDGSCVDDDGAQHAAWCPDCVLMAVADVAVVTTYAVQVPVAATAVDAIEGRLASSMESGALNAAVTAAGSRRRRLLSSRSVSTSSVNLTTTSNLVVQRLASSAAMQQYMEQCEAAKVAESDWRAVGIAFIIGFGVCAGCFGAALFVMRRRDARDADAAARVSVTQAAAKAAQLEAPSPRAAQLRQQANAAEV